MRWFSFMLFAVLIIIFFCLESPRYCTFLYIMNSYNARLFSGSFPKHAKIFRVITIVVITLNILACFGKLPESNLAFYVEMQFVSELALQKQKKYIAHFLSYCVDAATPRVAVSASWKPIDIYYHYNNNIITMDFQLALTATLGVAASTRYERKCAIYFFVFVVLARKRIASQHGFSVP